MNLAAQNSRTVGGRLLSDSDSCLLGHTSFCWYTRTISYNFVPSAFWFLNTRTSDWLRSSQEARSDRRPLCYATPKLHARRNLLWKFYCRSFSCRALADWISQYVLATNDAFVLEQPFGCRQKSANKVDSENRSSLPKVTSGLWGDTYRVESE